MNRTQRVLLSSVAVAVLALAACSGGGGSTPPGQVGSSPPPPPPPPVSTSVSAVGTITGFGSVFINGVRYSTDGTTVVAIEGQSDVTGDISALKLGMKVTVKGSESDGNRSASQVKFDDDLKGLAENIVSDITNPSVGTFTVVGQTVIVDINTVFDDDIGNNDGVTGIDIRDLDPAFLPGGTPMVVEVSGFLTDSGVVATRIERVNLAASDLGRPSVDGDEVEVKGIVDAVSADGRTITINGANFTITSATQLDDGLVVDASLVGRFVEIKADIDAFGDFIAVRVEFEDDLDGFGGDDSFEIEGILQSVDTSTDPDTIRINGLTIEVNDASSLVSRVGLRVEIKGSFDANGVLQLGEVELEIENSVRIEDRIASIDSNALTFTTTLGLTVTPTGASRIEDEVAVGGDSLSVAQFFQRLSINDFISARGFPAADGSVTWTRIEREQEDDQSCSLRGPVESGSILDPEFQILGVTVDTTGLGFGGFEDENDVDIDRATFFSRLQVGDIVQATSDDAGLGCTNGRLSTQSDGEVEFEPDDGVTGTSSGTDNDSGNGNDNEISGTVSNLDDVANTFVIFSQQIQVTSDTLIDSSIVERARGVQLGPEDLRFGDLPETLGALIQDGDVVEVTIDVSGNAIKIEDVG